MAKKVKHARKAGQGRVVAGKVSGPPQGKVRFTAWILSKTAETLKDWRFREGRSQGGVIDHLVGQQLSRRPLKPLK